MCDELGDEERMRAYVDDKGGTTLCDIVWGTDCSEKELKFINKYAETPKAKLAEEINGSEQQFAAGGGKDMKTKKRIMLLTRILENEDPEF